MQTTQPSWRGRREPRLKSQGPVIRTREREFCLLGVAAAKNLRNLFQLQQVLDFFLEDRGVGGSDVFRINAPIRADQKGDGQSQDSAE